MSDVIGGVDYAKIKGKLEEVWQSGGAGRETVFSRGSATFREYSGNPLIEPSRRSGDWREVGVLDPLVVLNPEDGKYYMLVSGRARDLSTQIGLFISDDGLHWEEHENNPVISKGGAGEFDEKALGVGGGTVVWDQESGKWRLYYWGRNAAGVVSIGVAESDDLKNWTKRSENPVITSRVANRSTGWSCCVFNRTESPKWIAIVRDVGRFQVSGGKALFEVYTSDDGISWTWAREFGLAYDVVNPLHENVFPMVPEVTRAHKLFGLFVILYEAADIIYRGQYYISALVSYDGIHWFQIPKPIYHDPGYGQRSPFHQTLHPCLLLGKDGALLYHAHAYFSKDLGGPVEWIEVAFMDPKWLLEVLTSQGVYYIWDNESVAANTNGYMYANKLNFREATIYFKSDTSGDLTVEVDPDGQGDWYTLYTRTGITEDVSKTTYDFTHLRMRFSVEATLTAKVVLKK